MPIMAVVLTNNATSLLAAAIDADDTNLSVLTADAGRFPNPAAGDWFPLTLVDNAGNMEIVKATARVGAIITVERGKEGTTAKAFAAGARVDLRLTTSAIFEVVPSAMEAAQWENENFDNEDARFFWFDMVARKLKRFSWSGLVNRLLPRSGGKMNGPIEGVAVSGTRSSFWTSAEGGAYAGMFTRGAPFHASATLNGSSYAPVIAGKYNNTGWAGIWSAGIINFANGQAAGFAIQHINASGNEGVVAEFRVDGSLRLGGPVYKGTATAAYGDGGTYWMHITGNAGYAANAGAVGGWSQGTIADQDNWRVTDTRFAGYVEHAMERDTGWHAPSGYVFTYAYRKGGDQYYFGARQPQIYIPNAGWRALGGW
ncbi:Conserved hypothetical protein (plasmid) [Brucella intermedia LMG 3301]|uniref:Tail fiber protein n=2 Tax=root TaxID=1 RepID=C4WRF2_9HYPH|nr:Conserved hypothetical protein [Brucella intermedia LMG 3301]